MKNLVLKTTALVIVFSFILCGCVKEESRKNLSNDFSINSQNTDSELVESISSKIEETSSGDIPQVYEYYGDDYDIEFIEWCKDCKVNDDFYEKYPDSKGVIDIMRTKNTILMPKIKSDDYVFYSSTASSVATTWYIFIYKTKKKINTEFNVETASQITVTFAPIPKELEGKSDKDILKSRLEDWEIKEDSSLYGTYAIKKSNHTVWVEFIRNDFIVILKLYDGRKPISEWGNKYWDLLELETVSLK